MPSYLALLLNRDTHFLSLSLAAIVVWALEHTVSRTIPGRLHRLSDYHSQVVLRLYSIPFLTSAILSTLDDILIVCAWCPHGAWLYGSMSHCGTEGRPDGASPARWDTSAEQLTLNFESLMISTGPPQGITLVLRTFDDLGHRCGS